MEKLRLLERGFIDNDFNTLGFDALHDALNAGSAKVVRTALHDEAVDADDLRLAFEDAVGDEVFASAVGLNNGVNQILWDILIIG